MSSRSWLHRRSRIEEGHLLADHVHMLIAIPPKHAVAQVIGFIKGELQRFVVSKILVPVETAG